MRRLPVPTLPFVPVPELFPPHDCPVCTIFVAVKGMEVNKALKLMRTAFQALCDPWGGASPQDAAGELCWHTEAGGVRWASPEPSTALAFNTRSP
jgi:hypothetical protein